MARTALQATGETAEANEGERPSPDLDTATLWRLVVERLRLLSPAGVAEPRLVWVIPGNPTPGVLPLAVPEVKLSELAAEILEVLKDAGGWLHGEEIGKRLNPRDPIDHTSGSFKRAMDELKDCEPRLIDSNTRKGYKAKEL